jgi:hypothetical protein
MRFTTDLAWRAAIAAEAERRRVALVADARSEIEYPAFPPLLAELARIACKKSSRYTKAPS